MYILFYSCCVHCDEWMKTHRGVMFRFTMYIHINKYLWRHSLLRKVVLFDMLWIDDSHYHEAEFMAQHIQHNVINTLSILKHRVNMTVNIQISVYHSLSICLILSKSDFLIQLLTRPVQLLCWGMSTPARLDTRFSCRRAVAQELMKEDFPLADCPRNNIFIYLTASCGLNLFISSR